jgi:ubiquitin-protein ligase
MDQNLTPSEILTIKRIKGEIKNLEKDRESYYQVVYDEAHIPKPASGDNYKYLFYFLLRGASDSVYKGGYYIGKITLPADYPTSPGNFYMLTPSGRFNINTKICLTNSSYHKDTWTPMWSIKNMVIGFVSDNTSGISHIV